jgi:hypothetical protein
VEPTGPELDRRGERGPQGGTDSWGLALQGEDDGTDEFLEAGQGRGWITRQAAQGDPGDPAERERATRAQRDLDRHKVDRAAKLAYEITFANRDSADGEDEVGSAGRRVECLGQRGLVVRRHWAHVGDRSEFVEQRAQRRRDCVVHLTRPERGARWADLVAGGHDAHHRAWVGDEMVAAHGGSRGQLARTEDGASRQDQRASEEVFTGGADMLSRLDGPIDDHRPTVDLRHLDRDDGVRASRHGGPRRDRDRCPGDDLTREGPAGQSAPEDM